MAENETKRNQTKQNEAESYSVTIGVTLSEQEQIDAAKQKAAAFNAANPDKLVAIGKPSATRDGLKVEFGVTK
jgi:hypothetical protein